MWRRGISHRGTAAPRPAHAQDKAAGGLLDQGWRGRAARMGETHGMRGLQGASGRRWVPWEGAEGLGRRGQARPDARAGRRAGALCLEFISVCPYLIMFFSKFLN
jgi:hypothetical protein